MFKELNGLQSSAIEDVFNIGLGRAAVSLSEMIADEVLLSAANTQLSNINTGKALDTIKKSNLSNSVSIAQNISGDIEANALVIFSETNAIEIVRKLVAPHIAPEVWSDYEHEVMTEVGNIILNACVSALANMLHLSVESYLPVHHRGECESVMLDNPDMPLKILMALDIIIAKQSLAGFITFTLNAKSMTKLLQHVETYLANEALV